MPLIAAAKAKADFLGLLRDVENKRQCFTVTKNGRPVARLVPLELQEEDPLAVFRYPGLQILVSDEELIEPVYSDEEYEEFFETEAAKYK